MENKTATVKARADLDKAIAEMSKATEVIKKAELAYEAAREKARHLKRQFEFEQACDDYEAEKSA